MQWVFEENNTHETWRAAKKMGILDQLEAARPKGRQVVFELYAIWQDLRLEAEELRRIKRADIVPAVQHVYYEQDYAVRVIQAADSHYLKLYSEKLKKAQAKKMTTTATRTIRIIVDSSNSQRQINQVNNQLNQTTQQAERAGNSIKKLTGFIAGFVSVAALAGATKSIAEIGDEYAKITGLLRNATESQEQFNDALALSKKVATDTRAGLTGTVETFAALNRVTQGTGRSQAELFGILSTINKSIALTSPVAESAAAALTQFGQALGGDFKAGAQELNSILEQAPGLAEAVARGLGVATKDLKKMGEEGELSTEKVLNALQKVSEDVDVRFSKIPKTVSSALTLVRNDLLATFGEADVAAPLISSIEEFGATLKDPAVSQGLVTLSAAVVKLVGWLASAAAEFANLGKEIGYFAALVTGNVSEFDKVSKAIEDINKNASAGFLTKSLGYIFYSKEDFDEEKERLDLIDKRMKQIGSGADFAETSEEIDGLTSQIKNLEKAIDDSNKALDKFRKPTKSAFLLDEGEAPENPFGGLVGYAKVQADEHLANIDRYNKQLEERKAKQKSILGGVATDSSASIAEPKVEFSAPEISAPSIEFGDNGAAAKAEKDRKDAQDKEDRDRAAAHAADEIRGAKELTASLGLELETRTQVASFYRQAQLSEGQSIYEQERAMLQAQSLEKVALINQRETEDAERRNEQHRQALDEKNLNETEIAAIDAAYKAQQIAAENVYQQEKNAIEEAAAQKRIAIAKAEKEAKIQLGFDMASSGLALLDAFGSQSAKSQQRTAKRSIILSTAQGVGKGVAAGMPQGIPLIAMALAQGKKAWRMMDANSPGGGGGGAASISSIAESIPTATSEPSAPQFQQKMVVELRGEGIIDGNSLVRISDIPKIMSNDNMVVLINGAQADAQRRGVI